MAYSTQRKLSDGTLALLGITIDYFERTEIAVFFDGVVNALPWAWVGVDDRFISFTPAVPAGVEVMIVRTTDLAELLHNFTGGAQFTYESLDENFVQILRIAQEARENSTITDIYQDLNLHGYRVRALGDGILPDDAVNKRQLEVHDLAIVGYMNQTKQYRDDAAGYAAQAKTHRDEAEGFAIAAANATVTQVNAGNTNAVLRVGGTTGAAQLPAGTAVQRPTGAAGLLRFNADTKNFEGHNGTEWGDVGGGAVGGSATSRAFYLNDTSIGVSYTIPTGKNAMTAGPITIANDVTVTVPSGCTWTVV